MITKDKIIYIAIVIFLVVCIIGMRISINNKQDYIDAIRSQKAVCDGQLETVKQDYRKLFDELEKIKGDIDE